MCFRFYTRFESFEIGSQLFVSIVCSEYLNCCTENEQSNLKSSLQNVKFFLEKSIENLIDVW